MDIVGRTLLGKYKVERLIGQGGMGSVWLGRHVMTGRQVAVKVLDERFLKTASVVQRFGREARAASAIQHEGIVEVLDLDMTEEGVPFLVMELLEGENLGRRIERKGRLTEEETLRIAVQLCDALHAAHECGVIHRDLKPDNIVVVPAGRRGDQAKILDFGISSKTDEASKLTVTGSVLGTPHYMSPEQAEGDVELDRRADVYSLGVLLYECVVGRVPYDAPNYNRLLRIVLEGKVVPPTERGATISEPFQAAILRAMARRVEDRPASAAALKAELLASQQPDARAPKQAKIGTLAGTPRISVPASDPPPAVRAAVGTELQLPIAEEAPAPSTPVERPSQEPQSQPRWDLDSLPSSSAASTMASRARTKPRVDAPAAAISGLDDLGPPAPAAQFEIEESALQTARKQTRISVPPADPAPHAPARSLAPGGRSSGRHSTISSPPPPPEQGPLDAAKEWWGGLGPTTRRVIQFGSLAIALFVGAVTLVRVLVRPDTAGDGTYRDDALVADEPEPSRDWVRVDVTGVPPGAELRLDGLPGVSLPLRIRAGTTHTLEIRAAGYEDRRIEIRGDDGARVDAAMVRRP